MSQENLTLSLTEEEYAYGPLVKLEHLWELYERARGEAGNYLLAVVQGYHQFFRNRSLPVGKYFGEGNAKNREYLPYSYYFVSEIEEGDRVGLRVGGSSADFWQHGVGIHILKRVDHNDPNKMDEDISQVLVVRPWFNDRVVRIPQTDWEDLMVGVYTAADYLRVKDRVAPNVFGWLCGSYIYSNECVVDPILLAEKYLQVLKQSELVARKVPIVKGRDSYGDRIFGNRLEIVRDKVVLSNGRISYKFGRP